MTSIETSDKKPSPKLMGLIANINSTYGKLKNVVMDAYNLAIEEGFTPQEAKNLLLENTEFLSQRTIYRYLPDEAKDEVKAKAGATRYNEIPANWQDPANWQEKDSQTSEEKVENITTIESPQVEQKEDNGKIAELQYKLDQSNTARKELMSQVDNLKKRITTSAIENVKSTGFIPSQEGDEIKTFYYNKISLIGLSSKISNLRNALGTKLFKVYMEVVDED